MTSGFEADPLGGVSRETLDRLEIYADQLKSWNRRINLIARSSEPDLWRRHVVDCAQLVDLAPPNATEWADIGSGAGLPGLIVAAIRAEASPRLRMTLIESDERKCAFMMEAARRMGLSVRVEARRLTPMAAAAARFDVVSARALAPLDRLLGLASPLLAAGGVALFPKGRGVEAEIVEARRHWRMRLDAVPSRTEAGAAILRIREPEHGAE